MKAAVEQAKAHFMANRSKMNDKELNEARNALNAMIREMWTQESIETFTSGESVDVQVFLSLLKHYNIFIKDSFNEWVQKDVVVVSKTGYDSYKISKAKAKELLSYVAQLTEAVDMPKLIEEVIAQQTEESEVEDMSSLTNTLDQNEMNAQAKVIRREGNITDRSDIEDEIGCVTSLWIEHRGRNWWIMMVNGEVCYLKQSGL